MRTKIQVTVDQEGKISSLIIPARNLKAWLIDANNIQFQGDATDLGLALQVLRAAFYSGIKANSLTLIDSGVFIHRSVIALVNATAVVYTVPGGKAFYLLGYDYNVRRTVGGLDELSSNMFYNDGVARPMVYGDGTTTTDVIHSQLSFTLLRIEEGTTLSVTSDNLSSEVSTSVYGVEINVT